MKTRTLTLTAVALLGSVIVLIGGYWFLGQLVSFFGEPDRGLVSRDGITR